MGLTFTASARKKASQAGVGVVQKPAPLWGIILVGAMFIGMGSVFFFMVFLGPLMRSREAAHWIATPCTVIRSEVQAHHSTDKSGSTYSIEVSFRYTFAGRSFVSDQYDLLDYASSGYASKQLVVSQLPPGTLTTCYVNPIDPVRAVMVRELGSSLWLGLIPMVFIIAGVAAVIAMIRSRRKGLNTMGISATATATAYLPTFDPAGRTIELRRSRGRWFSVIFMAFFALFWNGITWAMVINMLSDRHSGITSFSLLFMIPFVLVGLGVIVYLIYTLLQSFNPRPNITLSPSALRPGATVQVRWHFDAGAHKVSRLIVTLEGTERTTYRQGTNTRTDTSTFVILPLADTSSPSEIASGDASILLPIPLLHTINLSHNAINWKIKMHGEIEKWPDIKDEYDVVVLPNNWPVTEQLIR